MCEREVADPQMVHGAQGCHAAVDGVAPLHSDQAGRFFLSEGVRDACTGDKRMGEQFSRGGRGRASERSRFSVSPLLLAANMKTSGYFWHIL